ADLTRYLKGEAILAHRASIVYRFRKFSRRHWAALFVAGVLLVSGGYVGASAMRRSREVRAALANAVAFEKSGQTAQARDAYKTALDLDPGDAHAREGFDRTDGALRAEAERLKAETERAQARLRAHQEATQLLETGRTAPD